MRSTAHFKGHPLHPALIPFPFAFLIGAALFDLIGLLTGRSALEATARYLGWAGVASGVIAAIPGLIDYRYSVPPQSSGRRRARTHGLLNATALLLFTVALAAGGVLAPPLAAGLQIAGALLLVYSGWLGGVLVNRNLIGVDHRYADAGKWSELRITAGTAAPAVARADELSPGQMKLVHLGERRIVLGRTSRGYVAFDDRCTHRGGTLAGGVLIDTTVQCLWHGSQFDVESGEVRCGPAKAKIRCYRTETRDGKVILHT